MRADDQHDANRGVEAAQVLENPAFKAAMQTLRAQVTDQWRACSVRDREQQLLLLQLAKLTDKFEGLLVGLVETGKLAQNRIDVDAERDEHPARRLARRIL